LAVKLRKLYDIKYHKIRNFQQFFVVFFNEKNIPGVFALKRSFLGKEFFLIYYSKRKKCVVEISKYNVVLSHNNVMVVSLMLKGCICKLKKITLTFVAHLLGNIFCFAWHSEEGKQQIKNVRTNVRATLMKIELSETF